jgi:O-antigen ligase
MSEDMVLRYLPLLHNGYSQVIAKYGVVGLLLYVLFILGVVRGSNGWETTSRGNLLSDMRVGVGIIIAFTSLDITGLFNKSALDGICILLGAIYGYALAQGRHDDLRASSAKLNSV